MQKNLHKSGPFKLHRTHVGYDVEKQADERRRWKHKQKK